MKNVRQANVNIHKDAWVEINLESLANNIIEIKKGIPENKKFLAIVKADAFPAVLSADNPGINVLPPKQTALLSA